MTVNGDRPGLLSASVPDCDTCTPSTEHHLGDAEEPRRDKGPGHYSLTTRLNPGLPFLPPVYSECSGRGGLGSSRCGIRPCHPHTLGVAALDDH